jgi:hypothetical protein
LNDERRRICAKGREEKKRKKIGPEKAKPGKRTMSGVNKLEMGHNKRARTTGGPLSRPEDKRCPLI